MIGVGLSGDENAFNSARIAQSRESPLSNSNRRWSDKGDLNLCGINLGVPRALMGANGRPTTDNGG